MTYLALFKSAIVQKACKYTNLFWILQKKICKKVNKGGPAWIGLRDQSRVLMISDSVIPSASAL